MTAGPIKDQYDLAVIGAGPAGLAAATLGARLGLDTVLFDEQPAPGGQIYRAVTETPVREPAILGADYWHGAELAQTFNASGAQYVPGTTVWSITRDREIGISVGGGARLLAARHVILATGALERPFPIPGWTLPGVMACGAAQVLLKSSGMVPQGRIVLAGTGPLLWLLAAQYVRAGMRIDALLDTTPRGNWRAALPHAAAFLVSPYAFKGLALLREVKRSIRLVRGVTALAACGGARIEEVIYRLERGREIRMPADMLLLHHGVVPDINLADSIGCQHRWDEPQLCFVPITDDWGMSTVSGIAIAGDGAGIAGALAAEHRGRLAALDATRRLGKIDAARQVLEAVELGCPGPNQLKAFLRCGMGPCQGRLCGLTVTELIARARGASPEEVGYYRLRPPIKPITVAELAALPQTEAAAEAVVRG